MVHAQCFYLFVHAAAIIFCYFIIFKFIFNSIAPQLRGCVLDSFFVRLKCLKLIFFSCFLNAKCTHFPIQFTLWISIFPRFTCSRRLRWWMDRWVGDNATKCLATHTFLIYTKSINGVERVSRPQIVNYSLIYANNFIFVLDIGAVLVQT